MTFTGPLASELAEPARDRPARVDSEKLHRLVGRPRVASAATSNDDASRLVDMVEEAKRDIGSSQRPSNSGVKRVNRRSPHRRDWITIGAAAIAIVTLISTALFATVQLASATPVVVAVSALEEDEESLSIAEASLSATMSRVTDEIESLRGQTEVTMNVLASLDRDIVDSDALDAAFHASTQFVADLESIALPTAAPPYERGRIDTESLAEVARTIDEVQARLIQVDALIAEVRRLGDEVDAVASNYEQQMILFANSFAARAEAEIEANPWANQSSYDAVAGTLDLIAAHPLTTSAGQSALVAFQEAIVALRDDHAAAVRRVAEEDARLARRAERTPAQPADPVESEGSTEPAAPEVAPAQ